jgi:hypothetical protein
MSTATSKQNKATALARVQALIAGTKQHFPNGSFTLGNTAYTTASLLAALQGYADTLVALNAAHAGVKDAVKTVNAKATTVTPIVRDYRSFLRATFSTTSVQLADFGMQAPKARTPLTSDQRAAATAKVRATRKARGTTSKKQKLAVKGDVTGVIVTPVTHAGPTATPAPQGAPAPAVPAPAVTAK